MEFDLIQRYFSRPAKKPEIMLGNGDDCALVQSQHTLAFSIDTLVEGTHFTKTSITPFHLGYRALAVNLSDLAAMGAKPLAFLLALTLPSEDSNWLSEFSRGLFSLSDAFQMDLIGGNTTQGPLSITIQIIGELPSGKALKRSGAMVGDDIYVTGQLGEAAYALQTTGQLLNPTPRVRFAEKLIDEAHAAIDISDGLTQDLSHILEASKQGALLNFAGFPSTKPIEFALFGGEDYELCFTAPAENRKRIKLLAHAMKVPLSRIGEIISKPGIWQIENSQWLEVPIKGYQHFRAEQA